MKIKESARIAGLAALAILVLLGAVFCLEQAARADITPIIMPSRPVVPPMLTGVTQKPSAGTPTTGGAASFTPGVTAAPFGGMLG